VVIVGLAGVKAAEWFPSLGFMQKADAVAALAVAVIVIVVSAKLGLRTVQGLLDASPTGTAEQIKAKVETIDTVVDCHAVRVRQAGPYYFVDLHVTLNGNQPLYTAHALTERVERLVQEILPEADVTVHPEPAATETPPDDTTPDI